MTALLALHIETALDATETDLVRSMARISISQTMLLLDQGKDVPVICRALPAFQQILAQRSSLVLLPAVDQSLMAAPSQAPAEGIPSETGSLENSAVATAAFGGLEENFAPFEFDFDFLPRDFLDQWQDEPEDHHV